MIQKLFPFKLQLHIFQLEEYNPEKLIKWNLRYFFKRKIENKKPLVWTQKAKLLYYVSSLIAIGLTVILIIIFHWRGFIIGLLLATQPYIFLFIAYLLVLPLDVYKKGKSKKATEQKLASFKNLKIIGITGSYGKTSVKEFLYQILKTKHDVLKTPESYNTPGGIAKVVDLELDDKYEYFVCEMGAYKVGDIKEITNMVHPRYGILTGINEQHIETFGTLENTTRGKFELIDAIPQTGVGLVNIDNERIRNHILNSRFYIPIITYGFTDEKFSIKKIKQTPEGTEFILILDGKVYNAKTKLLGIPNLQNILAAATMSFLLGMDPKEIIKAIEKLQSVPHRLEIKEFENMTVIDDAYNSNVDGFKEAAQLLKSFNRPTIFVTPGIVDLGNKTKEIHQELGAELADIDHIILIGNSQRTQGLKEGIEDKNKIIELNSIKEVWQKIESLNLKNPVVLLENDLPDNY